MTYSIVRVSEDPAGGRVLVVAPLEPGNDRNDDAGSFVRGGGATATEDDGDGSGRDDEGASDRDDSRPPVDGSAASDDRRGRAQARGADPATVADGIADRLPAEVVLRDERTAEEYLAELGPTIDCVVVLGGDTGPLGSLSDDVSIPAVVCERPIVETDADDAPTGVTVATVAERVRNLVREARSRSDLQDRNTRLTVLGRYARDITGCETTDAVLDRTLEAATDALAFDYCVVLLVDGDRLVPRASVLPDPELSPVDVTEGIAGRTLETGEAEIVADMQSDPDAVVEHDDLHAVLSVPIGSAGVLQIASRSRDAFDDRDKEFAEILSGYTDEALARLEREAALRTECDRLHAFYTSVPVPVLSVERHADEVTVADVNDAYEEAFADALPDEPGEPLRAVVPTEAERDRYAAALNRNETTQGTVDRRVGDDEADVDLTVIPASPPGGPDYAFGVYRRVDGDD